MKVTLTGQDLGAVSWSTISESLVNVRNDNEVNSRYAAKKGVEALTIERAVVQKPPFLQLIFRQQTSNKPCILPPHKNCISLQLPRITQPRNSISTCSPWSQRYSDSKTRKSEHPGPGPDGARRPPRNFLTQGKALHQDPKSAADITFSFLFEFPSEKLAALANTSAKSWSGFKPSSGLFWEEKIVSCIDLRTASRSDLEWRPQ